MTKWCINPKWDLNQSRFNLNFNLNQSKISLKEKINSDLIFFTKINSK